MIVVVAYEAVLLCSCLPWTQLHATSSLLASSVLACSCNISCVGISSPLVNPWRRLADVDNSAGITLDDLPHVQAWMKRIEERPAVRQGIDVPEPFDKAAMQDPKKVQEAIDMVRKFTGTHKSEL
jgi:hypothetical protein